MKRLFYIAAGVLLSACAAKTSLPDINAGWNFSADDGRSSVVDLPHDAMLGAARGGKVKLTVSGDGLAAASATATW